MPIKTETGWKCAICGIEYLEDIRALSCEQSHDIIYVPFKREDLFRLVQFIYTKDDTLLSPGLIETIMKYKSQMRGKYE